MDDRLMTIDDLAAYLQVPKATVYAWRSRRNGPPAMTVGGRALRYRRADVDAWLAQQADGARTA